MADLSHTKVLCCFCNNVSVERVIESIASGAHSFDKIYDDCGAGVGPCGGTCRKKISQLIQNSPLTSQNSAAPKSEALPARETQASLPDEVLHAISLFNRRYYWEAHEVLEEIWLEERGSIRLLYQAIIQAAAAYYHVLNANPKGVLKLSQDSLEKLQKFNPAYWGLNLGSLAENLKSFQRQAREILALTRSGFDYDSLPALHFQEEVTQC